MKKRSGQSAPNWEDLLTLAVLARCGSYSAAARELGLTHATIGRRLARLQDAVGMPLLDRRDAGFELTEPGRLALAAAEDMERIADRLDRTLESRPKGAAGVKAVSGRVRLTATEALGTRFFLPRMSELQRRHPGLVVELILDSRTLSLARRKADLAIRLARPQQEGLVAKRLGSMGYALYMRRDHPDLAGVSSGEVTPPLCSFDESMAALPESRWLAEHLPETRCVFRTNSLPALHQAVRGGWGAGLLPCFLAGADEALHCLSGGPVLAREIWLAYPQEFRDVPRYRAVIDWLVAAARDEVRVLSG